MSEFLTVKEAARLTGKSTSSIRRVIYPIIRNDTHPDRAHVQPSPDEALQLRLKGENFAWRLSEGLLRRTVPFETTEEKGSEPPPRRQLPYDDAGLLAMLRHELDIKNQQITQQSELIGKQMELISGLSERLREGNILIASLQHRLALTDGRDDQTPQPPEPTRAPEVAAPEEGTGASVASTPPRKGFLARLFG